ncbi:hypothetical protein B0H10DRAFT_662770 [Mycena sp. CBHHK59/15]|nr:hypothetical protein B0H10DRAFT_662770 [Mycena sp. CBHHK59/15]
MIFWRPKNFFTCMPDPRPLDASGPAKSADSTRLARESRLRLGSVPPTASRAPPRRRPNLISACPRLARSGARAPATARGRDPERASAVQRGLGAV